MGGEGRSSHQKGPNSGAFFQDLCKVAKSPIELDWQKLPRFYRLFILPLECLHRPFVLIFHNTSMLWVFLCTVQLYWLILITVFSYSVLL